LGNSLFALGGNDFPIARLEIAGNDDFFTRKNFTGSQQGAGAFVIVIPIFHVDFGLGGCAGNLDLGRPNQIPPCPAGRNNIPKLLIFPKLTLK